MVIAGTMRELDPLLTKSSTGGIIGSRCSKRQGIYEECLQLRSFSFKQTELGPSYSVEFMALHAVGARRGSPLSRALPQFRFLM